VLGRASPMRIAVLHELDRAFHDSWPEGGPPARPVMLFGPRGGHVGLQLAVAADRPVSVRSEGGGLPAPSVFRVRFVPLEENSTFGDEPVPPGWLYWMTDTKLTPKALEQVVRAAPCEIAEVLVPATRGIKEEGRPVVLFLDYLIPPDVRPGVYEDVVRIQAGDDELRVPVSVEAFAMALPERQRLGVTNWLNVGEIAYQHKVQMWSDAYWSLLRKYARLMAAHRQTMFWVPREVFDLTITDGRVAFNEERLERYIKLFLREGFTQIEGPHISDRRGLTDPVTHMTWAATKPGDLGPVPTTVEGHALLRTWLTPFWEFLGKHGWQGMCYQHVFDEPLPAQAEHYRHLALIVRQLMPGVRLMDAVHIEGLNEATDLMVPSSLGGEERERTYVDEYERLGVEVWYYTCCGPRGKALNRLLDFPLIRTRLLHWYNYITRTTGYLHWGLNMYHHQDPWKQTVPDPQDSPDGKYRLPPGDTHIVWPGKDAVYGSLRFTAMRNGIEDYELLAMLRDDPKTAKRTDEIVAKVIRSGTSYIQDPRAFDRYRRRLLEVASGDGP
jgi:hypothetical protein